MDEKEKMLEVHETSVEPQVQASDRVVHSRRRLFRQGASVVAVTLASRPVLAWHCRTPSMWGSLVMNPNTSLKTHADHGVGFKDENWSIEGWKNNTSRSATGVSDRPWLYLVKNGINKSSILAASLVKASVGSADAARYVPFSGSPTATRYLDTHMVTVGELVAAAGLTLPNGMSGLAKVYDVLTNDFGSHLLVAQLNYKLLFPLKTNLMEKCFDQMDLVQMASGSYTPTTGMTWGKTEIVSYLQNNWVVLPNDGFSPTNSGQYFGFSTTQNSQP